jgi:cytochrome b involved in lipid metabolism
VDEVAAQEERQAVPREETPALEQRLRTSPRCICEEELSQHSSEDSCWISVNGGVFDVTEWLREHPGKVAQIMKFAGGDASEIYEEVFDTTQARTLLYDFRIGFLDTPEEHAKEELRAIHPDIRADISSNFAQDDWLSMSFAQKLKVIKEKMPAHNKNVFLEEDINFDITKYPDPFKVPGSTGRCPYGFDQVQYTESSSHAAKPVQIHDNQEVCPISGKTGTCPMQAMLGGKAPPIKPARSKVDLPQQKDGKKECVVS